MTIEWRKHAHFPLHEATLLDIVIAQVSPIPVRLASGEAVVRWRYFNSPLLRAALPADVRWRADEGLNTRFETLDEAKAAVEAIAQSWVETTRFMVRDHGLTAAERRTLWRLAQQGFAAQIGSGDCNVMEGFAAREILAPSIAVRPVELDENDQPVPDGYARYRITGYGEKLLGVS